MDYLKLCCVAPHPPILVPEVGGPEARKVDASARALRLIADDIESIAPETLFIMSPHSQLLGRSFAVKEPVALGGSLSMFGAPQVRVDTKPDVELADALIESAGELGVPCEPVGRGGGHGGASELDHGILVPLYFLARRTYPMVCISLSMLDLKAHYLMGVAIRKAAEALGRTSVFIASGDMSHRLIPGAPAGYTPRGAEFDRLMVDIMSSGDFARFFSLDTELTDEAGECGLRSLLALAGVFDGYERSSEVLSYEGPFGVGYMVARVRPGAKDDSASLLG